MNSQIIHVPPEFSHTRLDAFLRESIPDRSRSFLAGLIADGRVCVDQRRQTKAGYRLKGGETVKIRWPQERSSLVPYPLTIPVVYEDDDVLVVEKPPDLTVHPPNPRNQRTLVNALLFMQCPLSPVNPLRPGVVHRLDRETSGLMVLAKHTRAHHFLVGEFKERRVGKRYAAICWGTLKKDRMVLDLPLKRDARNRLKMKISFRKAKEARTEIAVRERLRDATFLDINLYTGRMHQIRVHMKFLGYPLVGDRKYGRKDQWDGLLLHSRVLSFLHPSDRKRRRFESPLPARFDRFLKERR
ncbi:MAG: RluA family pseudouridine synthase [Candidatus Omnitrophica bacterium]|nr:RluA family pseudouridine synthase [Candidatus Omnitrophota bacterium]